MITMVSTLDWVLGWSQSGSGHHRLHHHPRYVSQMFICCCVSYIPVESVPPVPEVVHSMPNIDDALDLPSTSDVLLDSTPPVILICLDSPLTLISAPTDNVIMSTRPDGADDIATIAPVEPSIPKSQMSSWIFSQLPIMRQKPMSLKVMRLS